LLVSAANFMSRSGGGSSTSSVFTQRLPQSQKIGPLCCTHGPHPVDEEVITVDHLQAKKICTRG
jgi:hypothetical protein